MTTSVHSMDFRYVLDLGYDYGCSGCYGCESDNDYCRGGEYSNFSVNNLSPIHLAQVVEDLLEKTLGEDVDARYVYALTRAIEVDKSLFEALGDIDNWSVHTEGGYYGDELGTVRMNSDVADRVEIHRDLILSLKADVAVQNALCAEYGKLLPRMDHFETWAVPYAQIDASNPHPHAERVDTYMDKAYVFSSHIEKARKVTKRDRGADRFPMAIVRPAKGPKGKYRIIDGNHRYTAYGKLAPYLQKSHVIVLIAKPKA